MDIRISKMTILYIKQSIDHKKISRKKWSIKIYLITCFVVCFKGGIWFEKTIRIIWEYALKDILLNTVMKYSELENLYFVCPLNCLSIQMSAMPRSCLLNTLRTSQVKTNLTWLKYYTQLDPSSLLSGILPWLEVWIKRMEAAHS